MDRVVSQIKSIYLHFSVPILLPTLFSPWRRIVSTGQGTLGERFHAQIDNFVSRWVGLSVRLAALFAAGILMFLNAVIGGIVLIVWPLMPLAGIGLIIGGIFI